VCVRVRACVCVCVCVTTNALAGDILRQLGLSEDKVQAVLGLSVKQVAVSLPHLPQLRPECRRIACAKRTPVPRGW